MLSKRGHLVAVAILLTAACSSEDDGEPVPSTTAGGGGGGGGTTTASGTTGGGGTAAGTGGADGGSSGTPQYTPLVAWDFEAGTAGQPVGEVGTNHGDRFTYSGAQAKRGSQSGKVDRNLGEPPPTCGGGRFYGFTDELPVGIGPGDTIWIRAWFYFPSEMSWGYVFSTADGSDIAACGASGPDGWGWTKFLALGPDTGHLRPYLQIPGRRRQVARPTDAGGALYLLNSETGGANLRVGDEVNDAIPLDRWVAIQWMLYVHDTDGFSRAWLDDRFLGETPAGSTIEDASYTHDEWRLGDYWNGFPYTDGEADRGPFYLDEVIVATDQAGYGAPEGTDGGGRRYIAPATNVSDFSF